MGVGVGHQDVTVGLDGDAGGVDEESATEEKDLIARWIHADHATRLATRRSSRKDVTAGFDGDGKRTAETTA